jgi:hypothetical protein
MISFKTSRNAKLSAGGLITYSDAISSNESKIAWGSEAEDWIFSLQELKIEGRLIRSRIVPDTSSGNVSSKVSDDMPDGYSVCFGDDTFQIKVTSSTLSASENKDMSMPLAYHVSVTPDKVMGARMIGSGSLELAVPGGIIRMRLSK